MSERDPHTIEEGWQGAWVYCCRCWSQVPLSEAHAIAKEGDRAWLCLDCLRDQETNLSR